jgi:tripartite-type tricarboxylate transporter receptor subunit TctC
MIVRRQFLQMSAAAAALSTLPRPALAQAYPTRPIRMLVATSAGGNTDLAARIIAQWLTERLGQTVIVENRPGGANNIGTEAAVRAPADGYTLYMANLTNTVNMTLYKNHSFNFIDDMAPVALAMESTLAMQVHPSVAAKTAAEFIADAKAHPGKINMGSGGNGSAGQMAGALLQMMAGIKLTHVPYRGEAMAMTDLIGGQVQMAFTTLGSAMQYIRAGQVRALAVTSATRTKMMSDVPPLSDSVPGYEMSSWNGIMAPKGTPPEIIQRLNKEINASYSDPKIIKRFTALGAIPVPMTAAEFGKLLRDDAEKWAKVIPAAGIKVE